MGVMMDRVPKVSVACAWYNRADYIHDTLDSLLAQDLDNFEIVLVNDGSPDPRVREILDSYDDPRLRIIHQENTGFTTAIRRAISASKAPFIAIQGSGDISRPARLRLQWEALQATPSVAIVGCHYEIENMVTGQHAAVVPQTPQMGDIRFTGISHGELMYRREIYDRVGGYRTIFAVGQGADLWMRLLRKDGAVVVAEPLYVQRHFADGVAHSADKLAARRIMNGVRIENELCYRRTGVDHIDLYGAAAFSILGRTGLAKRELIETRVQAQSTAIVRRDSRVRLELPFEIEIAFRRNLKTLRGAIRSLLRGGTAAARR